MNKRINGQINKEQFSPHLYLAMAAAFEKMGLKVFAQYYYNQANRAHSMIPSRKSW
jgi:ferritin